MTTIEQNVRIEYPAVSRVTEFPEADIEHVSPVRSQSTSDGTKSPTAPSIDDIRDQSIRQMSTYQRKSYMGKHALMDKITDATSKGKQQVTFSPGATKYKVLKFYSNLGYKIKKQKKKSFLGRIFGVEEIIISWK